MMLLMTSVTSWTRPSGGLLLSCRWPSGGSGDMHGVISAQKTRRGGQFFAGVKILVRDKSQERNLTGGSVVGNALQLLHNVDVQQLKGQQVLRMLGVGNDNNNDPQIASERVVNHLMRRC